MIKRHKKNLRGIVMVEALMSIAIMMISVMAPITLSTQSAKYAKYTLNKITASYLAEEQIEMMVNFKKSLDIYCFDNTNCANQSSFDEFIQKVTSINGGLDCETYKIDGSYKAPCYFDESSFTYSGTTKPEIVNKTDSCKFLYEKPNDIMSCTDIGGTGNKSIFTRKMYIDSVDNIESNDGNQFYENVLKLTSWVCINNKDCKPEDTKATTLVYFIYK